MATIGEGARAVRSYERKRRRRLTSPVDAAHGLLALPRAMPLAYANAQVTYDISANDGASQFAGKTDIVYAYNNPDPKPDPRLRRLSSNAVRQAAASGPGAGSAQPAFGSGSPAVQIDAAQRYESVIDAGEFEVTLADQGAGNTMLRLLVDGEWVAQDGINYSWANNGHYVWVRFRFFDEDGELVKKPRHVVIETHPTAFRGLVLHATDACWIPATDPGPMWVVAGDSFAEVALVTPKTDGFAYTMARSLGVHRMTSAGRGGTGLLRVNSGSTYPKLRDRLTTDIYPHDPDVIVIAMGINDHAHFTGAQIKAELLLTIAAMRAWKPSVTIIVVGPWYPTGVVLSTVIQCRDALLEGATESGCVFIDPICGAYPYTGTIADYTNKGWVNGDGVAWAPTGNGNSDVYTGHAPSDATHPTRAGQIFLGLQLAADINAWRAAGCPRGAVVRKRVVTISGTQVWP